MAHIAVRTTDNEGWQFVEGTAYRDESFLRDLVYEEPRLIPAREIGMNPDAQVVTLREVGLPGAGASDVIMIDSEGAITVVECKLATNPEKKRAVIGQVLDYASSLSRMSYDDLNTRCETGRQSSLHELMQQQVPADQWDEDQFRAGVVGTLNAGTFGLVIAIDEMDPDLARILHYVSLRSRGSLSIYGLEMRYYKQGGVEAIIPHIANPVEPTTRAEDGRWRSWGPDELRNELGSLNDDRVRDAALDILEFALENSDAMYRGRSQQYGSFGYGITRPDGKRLSLFTCYTDGTFYLNLGTLWEKIPVSLSEDFVGELKNLKGFERLRGALTDYPQFQIRDTLADELVRIKFKEAVLTLQKAISDTAEP